MNKVRIGIIGIGNMGSGHSLYLHPGYEKLREKIKNSNTTKSAKDSTVLDVSETY